MNKIARISLVFVFLVLIPHASLADFNKTKIAVLDFQLQGEDFETMDMGKIVAEWIITGLVQAGRFDVIERGLLEKILKEQELPMYGIVDTHGAAKTGKIVGAKVIITGSVMKLRQFMEVSARLINVEDGSIIAAEKVKSESAIRLEDLVSQMIDKIIMDFPLEGYIVQRKEDDEVVIDLGRISGVRVGKRFSVFKEGKVIRHPKTGEVLDIERIETGEIEIRDVKKKTAVAVILVESPDQKIEYGNMVRSLSEPSVGIEPLTEETIMPLQTPGQFNIGEEYYILTTIHVVKNTATWKNRTDIPAIKAGEKVVLTKLDRSIAKFTWQGNEYTFVYHHAKTTDPYMLSKFLTKDNPLPDIAGFPEDIKSYIAQGEAKIGMTKWQILYSKGAPVVAGDRKTFDMALEAILNTNSWIYLKGRRKVFVEFLDDKVINIRE